MSWTEILTLLPPTSIALLVVIIWLFKCLERKDKMVQELGILISANSEATCKLSTLVSILVSGRRT
jgi:hypothetical protein